MQAQIDQFVQNNPSDTASDSDQLIAAAGSVISDSADEQSATPPVEPPAAPAAQPPAAAPVEVPSAAPAPEPTATENVAVPETPAPEANDNGAAVAHKKVILPPNASESQKPDLDALLAIEEAKEAAAGAPPPPAVVSGDGQKPPIDPNSVAL
jgi:hypothetical protein